MPTLIYDRISLHFIAPFLVLTWIFVAHLNCLFVTLPIIFIAVIPCTIFCSPFHYLQRWARAFRDDFYHRCVDTNNGVEAQNRVLKYTYLRHCSQSSLSQIVKIIVQG